ncbi:hypothetical protein [Tahibacter amnicola]|uniref:Polyketide synthase-like dehydratase family protein n=1 Tax=Tahibacter amnicola TaxID=2976241 RepID=A0ABY6BJB9_9GAMM|nr:hypothetical protein [Tahibacter amnicola]UXI69857.1 hypothetical protein N4264_09585 [Tahibacter amnicola]
MTDHLSLAATAGCVVAAVSPEPAQKAGVPAVAPVARAPNLSVTGDTPARATVRRLLHASLRTFRRYQAHDCPHPRETPAEPVQWLFRGAVEINHERYPELFDYERFRAPDEATLRDRNASASLGFLIELAVDVVTSSLSGVSAAHVTGLRQVEAMRPLLVREAMTVPVFVAMPSRGGYRVLIGDYFSAVVEVGAAHEAPRCDRFVFDIEADQRIVDAVPLDRLYRERWLFQGRSYRGLRSIEGMDETGAVGLVAHVGGKGSLLEGVFQLASLWTQFRFPFDSGTQPVRLDRMDFFAPISLLRRTATLECRIFVDEVAATEQVFSAELVHGEHVVLRLDRFTATRCVADTRTLDVYRRPQGADRMCDVVGGRVFVFDFGGRAEWVRTMLRETYLLDDERARLAGMADIDRDAGLFAMVAGKDALKHWLMRHYGLDELHPMEIRLVREGRGVFGMAGFEGERRPVGLGVHGDIGVAVTGSAGRVGIDVRRVDLAPRPRDAVALDADESAWLDAQPPSARLRASAILSTAKTACVRYRELAASPWPGVRKVRAVPGGWEGTVDGVCFKSCVYADRAVISWISDDDMAGRSLA